MKTASIAAIVAIALDGCRDTEDPEAASYLGNRLDGADRMIVWWQTGFTEDPPKVTRKEIVESDRNRVRALVGLLQVERTKGPHKCEDGPTFEFYQGEQRICSVLFSHGKYLRKEGSSQDAHLTEKSALAMREYLASHAIPQSPYGKRH